VVQSGEDSGFGEKCLNILGLPDAFGIRHLDGYLAIEVIVMGKIDPPKPTLAQASEDRVTPDLRGIANRGTT
jgi:hypothetical protein